MSVTNRPLGWAERYLCCTNQDQIPLMKKWLADGRGVAVWVNVDLTGGPKHSRCGHLIFTPGDIKERPHWAYVLVEVLPDGSRLDLCVSEVRRTKPTKSDGEGWAWDRRAKEWYREVPYEDPSGGMG